MLNLKELDALLADQSYVSGHCPTQQDCLIFDQLSECPSDAFPHLRRWFRHISTFGVGERHSFLDSLGNANLNKIKVFFLGLPLTLSLLFFLI